MKQRISGLLYSNWVQSKDKRYISELDAINMADISTIHSFCERLLRRFGLQIDIAPNFSVKSFKRESNEIVSRLVAEQYGNAILEPISSGALVRSIMLLLNDRPSTYTQSVGLLYKIALSNTSRTSSVNSSLECISPALSFWLIVPKSIGCLIISK